MNKKSNHKTLLNLLNLLNSLNIPFSGATISSQNKKYYIAPFQQISISAIGPIFYLDKKSQKFYTLLQRRFKDNFQWWFPGGYVELPSKDSEFFSKNFKKIKAATIGEFYKNSIDYNNWQKAWQEVDDAEKLKKIFKKHKINWPKEIDLNWCEGWKREVLEETGVDINKFPQAKILSLRISKTLMLGAEPDRLINIDGKFCGFLGELAKAPKFKPDDEVEELKWIALEEIIFDEKQKKYFAEKASVNPYVLSLIDEALFEMLCAEIKEISKIKNPFSKQEVSRFNSPQNLQVFLLEWILKQVQDDDVGTRNSLIQDDGVGTRNFLLQDDGVGTRNSLLQDDGVRLNARNSPRRHPELVSGSIAEFGAISKFLSHEFAELNIAKNLHQKSGDFFYKAGIAICKFISLNDLNSKSDFKSLEKILQKIK